jgi:ParB/RepB/Spo0J family partition protein
MTAAAVLKAAGPDALGELRRIPLAQLVESPWNPRKHFDPAKLAETAESLRVNGQLTPITVRPWFNHSRTGAPVGERYEIGAGHRRFRAAQQLGLASLLAVVRPLDDVAFLELLTIENKQREDVTPLDEAAGFKLLMEKAGYDVAKLANRIGLSTKYVYDRLKLLQLIPQARAFLEDGTITAGHAILLARLTPKDQQRAIGRRGPRHESDDGDGGLFEFEESDELDLKDHRKARSVRELAAWIHDNVRMAPETVDGFLFPDTAHLVTQAQEAELEVVHITHDYRVADGARDEKERTYGRPSWKRADGKHQSKPCEHRALGVVVAGPDQGQAFYVCVRKDKCKIHWAAEQREAARRAKEREKHGITKSDDRVEQAYKRQQTEEARREQEATRWEKAMRALQEALAAKIKTAPIAVAITEVLKGRRNGKLTESLLPAGRAPESVLRHLALDELLEEAFPFWDMPRIATAELKRFGIDARKIVDQVAPKPGPEKKPVKKGK